jgi:hypothetical protein
MLVRKQVNTGIYRNISLVYIEDITARGGGAVKKDTEAHFDKRQSEVKSLCLLGICPVTWMFIRCER